MKASEWDLVLAIGRCRQGKKVYLGGLHVFSGRSRHSTVVALAGTAVLARAAVLRGRYGDRGRWGCLVVRLTVVGETLSFREWRDLA